VNSLVSEAIAEKPRCANESTDLCANQLPARAGQKGSGTGDYVCLPQIRSTAIARLV
jgi:hypothetical protein